MGLDEAEAKPEETTEQEAQISDTQADKPLWRRTLEKYGPAVGVIAYGLAFLAFGTALPMWASLPLMGGLVVALAKTVTYYENRWRASLSEAEAGASAEEAVEASPAEEVSSEVEAEASAEKSIEADSSDWV